MKKNKQSMQQFASEPTKSSGQWHATSHPASPPRAELSKGKIESESDPGLELDTAELELVNWPGDKAAIDGLSPRALHRIRRSILKKLALRLNRLNRDWACC